MTRLVITLSLLCLASLAGAAPGLYLVLDKTSLELGKPLRAALFAVDAEGDLDQLDLAPLREHFGVIVRDGPDWVDDKRWPDSAVQRMRLRLYPRETGELSLPALQLGDLRGPARSVVVREARHDGGALRFRATLSTRRPWQRQQLILWAEVSGAEDFASLSLDPDWHPAGFEVVPLPPRTSAPTPGKERVLGIGWALFPSTPGEHLLAFPSIDYRLGGGIERRFYPPLQRVRVKPLPPYVPPTLPVGRLRLTSHVEPAGPLPAGSLAWWTLELRADGLTPRWLPSPRQWMHSGEDVAFFTAEVTRRMRPDRDGVHGEMTVRQPLKPLGFGRLALPEPRIDYFDPVSGRLERLVYRPPRPWIYHPTGLLLALFPILVGIGILVARLGARLTHGRQRRQARRRLLCELATQQDPHRIRAALKPLAELEGWPANLTLAQWARRWRSRYRVDAEFDRLFEQLSTCCYGGESDHARRFPARTLARLLRQRRKNAAWTPGTIIRKSVRS